MFFLVEAVTTLLEEKDMQTYVKFVEETTTLESFVFIGEITPISLNKKLYAFTIGEPSNTNLYMDSEEIFGVA